MSLPKPSDTRTAMTPRPDDHPAHESPLSMLIPIAVLAFGATFAGVMFRSGFIGAGYEAFWKHSLFLAKDNRILEDMENAPALVSLAPTIMMLGGFAVAYYMYIVNKAAPAALAKAAPPLYQFLLNKWYFDELYDYLFVRPAFWIGRLFWKGGDGFVIDGFGPDGISARVLDVAQRRRAAADRLRLSLRLRDADRRRGAGDLVPFLRESADVRELDSFGAADPAHRRRFADPDAARRKRSGQEQCALDRAVDDADHLHPQPLRLGRVRYGEVRLPARRDP